MANIIHEDSSTIVQVPGTDGHEIMIVRDNTAGPCGRYSSLHCDKVIALPPGAKDGAKAIVVTSEPGRHGEMIEDVIRTTDTPDTIVQALAQAHQPEPARTSESRGEIFLERLLSRLIPTL